MNKLHVTNLAPSTTEESLRAHFATCGGVCDVEIARDRQTGNPTGRGSVTMTSPHYTSEALARLDGRELAGRALRVSEKHERVPVARSTVRVTQQYRERNSMAYDVDCSGTGLTFRMYLDDGERWRIEACSSLRGADATVVSATAATRGLALAQVLAAWNMHAVAAGGSGVDAAEVTTALREVRAA